MSTDTAERPAIVRTQGPLEDVPRRRAGRRSSSTWRSAPARSTASSGPTAPARARPSACSRPASTPTGGEAEVGGVDIIRHPALAKQVIGVVPQTNTLDRAMTVAENLHFHGRYFGMSTKQAKAATDELLVKVRLADRADASVDGAVGRHGPAADGGAGDHAPPADPVPRRADGRPRPAEPHRAVGDRRRAAPGGRDDPPDDALHGGGRPALRPRRDHGPRRDPRPRHARAAQGARPARRRSSRSPPIPATPTASAATSSRPSTPVTDYKLVDGQLVLVGDRRAGCCRRSSPPPSRSASTVTDLSVERARRSRPSSST